MSRSYLRFWPIPTALAVCGIVATGAGAASPVAHAQKASRIVASATPVAPAAKPAPAAAPAAPAERRRANLVFLVDVSAPMNAPGKLPLVQKTLLEAVEFLDSRDRVSIVAYTAEARVLLPSTPVSNRAAIIQVINGLSAQGNPGTTAGLALAYVQASRAFVTGGINHVLVCTGGAFKSPAAETATLTRLVQENRQAGVTLTVLGYGAGAVDADTARRLGQLGANVPPHIAGDAQMHSYVRERLLSVADDAAPPRI